MYNCYICSNKYEINLYKMDIIKQGNLTINEIKSFFIVQIENLIKYILIFKTVLLIHPFGSLGVWEIIFRHIVIG